MATWLELAKQNLDAAKQLHDTSQVRSCLNRAYYCAYAQITGVLVGAGQTVSSKGRSNPGHEQLLQLARHNLATEVRSGVTRRLRRLRSFRLAADYDPESELSSAESLEAVQAASEILKVTGG